MKNCFLLFFFLPFMAAAQNFHFSPRVGIMGYHGDLKKNALSLSQTKLMFSLGARYDLAERLSARSYFTYGSLRASDHKGTAAMRQRNLSFESKIIDWEIGAQYNLLNLNYQWWTPYVFAGIGVYRFNPYTKETAGNRYYLKQLSTEGQGFTPGIKNYSLTQLSIPLGVGVDYLLSEDQRIGLELGYRRLFTDYLDDVSNQYTDEASLLSNRGPRAVELAYRGDEVNASSYPAKGTLRGDPNKKDGYYYVAITYTFRFWFDKYKQTSGIPGGGRERKQGCPSTRN